MSEWMAKDMSERMPEDMSERMLEDMSERMSEDMSEEMSERYVRRDVRKNVKRYVRKMSERMSEDMSEWMSKDMSEWMSKDMSGRMSKDMSERMSKDMSGRMSEDMSERMSEDMSKDMSGRMSGDISERYVKKNARRYVRMNGERYVRKNARRYVTKNGERYVRKTVKRHVRRYARKMSERMSEDMSERMSKDMSQRTGIHVCTNGILWMALCFLFDVAHCSKYCWLNFFLCKEVSLVWQPWRRLWWNVLRPSSLGLPIGLPKELSMCGATSWLLLVLSASTCAWSRLALHMLGIVCLSCQKLWRETCGMWRMKGGLFQMRRASKSWRSVLQSFALRPRFGRMECTSGRHMMCGAEPPTQKKWKNHSGKRRASWFAHAMRCSCGTLNPFAFLDSTAFCLMHVVCVCVCNYRRFASLDLTAFWRGGPMHWEQWHLTGTKLSWILLLLRGVR